MHEKYLCEHLYQILILNFIEMVEKIIGIKK